MRNVEASVITNMMVLDSLCWYAVPQIDLKIRIGAYLGQSPETSAEEKFPFHVRFLFHLILHY